MTNNDIRQRPNRIPWPPILLLTAVLAAWVLETLWPASALFANAGPALTFMGATDMLVGIALDLAAMWAMRRQHTNVLPHRAAQKLVTDGVFAFSRNPIYLGNTVLLIGLALVLRWPWLVACALVAALLVDRLAIRREERHLRARFGQDYTDYAARVSRWIGRNSADG